jgi:hypothetical protein
MHLVRSETNSEGFLHLLLHCQGSLVGVATCISQNVEELERGKRE